MTTPIKTNEISSEPCGVLCLDKPEGVSSHDMVGRIRKLYATRKVGHTGTLDPMATGVLVILIGRATKLSDFLLASEKEYLASLKLGITTDTQDITGKILSECDTLPAKEEVEAAAKSFLGRQMQTPPMYSAKKVDGQKLYDLARQGTEVDRAACEIEIRKIDLSVQNEASGNYDLDIICSKGTYIRTLCHDLGVRLGCGGVMSALRRVRNGSFTLSDAHTIEELESLTMEERINRLLPVEEALLYYPKVDLSPFFGELASHGCEIYQKKLGTTFETDQLVRLYRGGQFFALGQVRDFPNGTAIKPIRQF